MKCRSCGDDDGRATYQFPMIGPMHGECAISHHAAALAERDKEIERLKQECAEVKEDRNKWRIVAEAREARLARLEEAGRMGLDALYAGCATASDGPCAWECENSTADDVNDCARYGCGAAVDALRAALEGEVKP